MLTEKDSKGIFYPHDDALIVKMNVAGRNLNKVLVNSGRSVDILLKNMLDILKSDCARFEPEHTFLYGFGKSCLYLLGKIYPPITVGDKAQTKSMMFDFIVVDTPMVYQTLLGRAFYGSILGCNVNALPRAQIPN